MISDGIDGMLVNAGDYHALAHRMDMVYLDHELRASLVNGGLRRVRESHSLESMARETKKVLHHILEERG